MIISHHQTSVSVARSTPHSFHGPGATVQHPAVDIGSCAARRSRGGRASMSTSKKGSRQASIRRRQCAHARADRGGAQCQREKGRSRVQAAESSECHVKNAVNKLNLTTPPLACLRKGGSCSWQGAGAARFCRKALIYLTIPFRNWQHTYLPT